MSGSPDRLDDSRGDPFEQVAGARRWGPLLLVAVALAVVLVAVAVVVYVAKVTQPLTQAAPTPPTTTSSTRLAGRGCIALDLTAIGAPAVEMAGSYTLRVLVGDNGGSCVLRPSAVSLLAPGRHGSQRAFASPAAAVRAGPLRVVDYEVAFAPSCTARPGSVDVLLSVGGSPLDVSGATIPKGLASCHRVRMTASSNQ